MPFHLLSNSSSTKYSSIEEQKIHEHEYKKFLKTLPIHKNNSSKQKLVKQQQMDFNNNYLIQRQINLQYREDKRKNEYARIQKENLRFSQRLIHAKAFLNRQEQQAFFDKHCKLKQRLQHYPDFTQNETKNYLKIINKPVDSAFLIYNDHIISQKSIELLPEKNSCSTINQSQKKLPHLIKRNPQSSKLLSPIPSSTQRTPLSTKKPELPNIRPKPSKAVSLSIPSPHIIHGHKSTITRNLYQSSSLRKPNLTQNILSSQSSSSDLFL